jgi:hypothetical protein
LTDQIKKNKRNEKGPVINNTLSLSLSMQVLLPARHLGQGGRPTTRLPVCWRTQRHCGNRLYGRLKKLIQRRKKKNNPFPCSSPSRHKEVWNGWMPR